MVFSVDLLNMSQRLSPYILVVLTHGPHSHLSLEQRRELLHRNAIRFAKRCKLRIGISGLFFEMGCPLLAATLLVTEILTVFRQTLFLNNEVLFCLSICVKSVVDLSGFLGPSEER